MSVNLEDLDPDSPEYFEALEAAQNEEDEANGSAEGDPQGDAGGEGERDPGASDGEGDTTDKAAADPAAATTEAATTEASAETTTPEKQAAPAGVLSKDGKHVLSYAVLKGAREEKRAEREARLAAEAERDRIKQELEDLKAGKTAAPANASDLSEDELAELATDFPWAAKLHKELVATRQQVEELRGSKKAAKGDDDNADAPADTGNPIQDAIDSTPLLPEWQAADPEKFQRAIEIDMALRNSRKWKDKPLEDRFAFVAKQVADEFDLEFPDAPQPKTDPGKPEAAKAVIERAQRAAPNTLSDFKGGAADPTAERIERMSPQKALARMAAMSDDEIDAYLAKLG